MSTCPRSFAKRNIKGEWTLVLTNTKWSEEEHCWRNTASIPMLQLATERVRRFHNNKKSLHPDDYYGLRRLKSTSRSTHHHGSEPPLSSEGPCINYGDSRGWGGWPNDRFTTYKPYSVKMSTKGVKYPKICPRGLWMAPTVYMSFLVMRTGSFDSRPRHHGHSHFLNRIIQRGQ